MSSFSSSALKFALIEHSDSSVSVSSSSRIHREPPSASLGRHRVDRSPLLRPAHALAPVSDVLEFPRSSWSDTSGGCYRHTLEVLEKSPLAGARPFLLVSVSFHILTILLDLKGISNPSDLTPGPSSQSRPPPPSHLPPPSLLEGRLRPTHQVVQSEDPMGSSYGRACRGLGPQAGDLGVGVRAWDG